MPLPALTCAILTHPSREDRAGLLAKRLAALRPVVVVDPTYRPGNLIAALDAWSLYSHGCYHLVVQDDAWPVPGFVTSARRAVAAAAGAGVVFWMRPWHPDAQAHRTAPPGSLTRVSCAEHWPPTVALALPPGVIGGLLDHARECHRAGRYDDDVIGCYLHQAGVPLVACSPSIIRHDTTVPSILNARLKPRHMRGVEYVAKRAPHEWAIA